MAEVSQIPSINPDALPKPDQTAEDRLRERASIAESRAGFDRSHQTAYPINTDINSDITGNFKTGPMPAASNSPEEFARNAAKYIGQADSWADDKYSYGKTFSYGAGYRNMNFDRYYSQSGFKKLGFSPFRDNEKVYNNNTSGSADFGRMASGWLGMAGLGAKDLFTEWFDYGINNDVVHSQEMSKRMANMTSSRDNTAGWITNFGANTAYTAGILGEIAGEELALMGATALTEGFGIGVTGPGMAAKGSMGVKKLAEGYSAMNNIRKSLSSIKSVSDARELFTLANAGEKALGVAKWLNPLSRTAEFAGNLSELKNLSNFAKLSKGVGSLYRDIREIGAVTSESKLEGGSTQNEVNENLINDFYKKNGRLPEGEEAKKIFEESKKAGFATTLSNIPLIYFSNKIVFRNALKGFKPLESFLTEEAEEALSGKVLVNDPLTKTSKFVSKYSLPGIKNIFKPSNILKGSLRYTMAELTEGLQETSQDAISSAFKDYYEQDYKDPNLSSLKSSFVKGMGSQLSGQGLDTFLSGFLMGGVLQGPQKLIFEGIPSLTKKIFNPEGYKEYQNQKAEYLNSITNAMNDIQKNPSKYVKAINSIDKNFVMQRRSSQAVDQSLDQNNNKEFQDSKDESAFHHIYTLLQSGNISSLTDQIKSLKELSPEELSEAFGEKSKNNSSLHDRLNSLVDKVDYLKDRFDVIEKKMVNPFDPSKKTSPQDKLTEHLAREEFDELKKMALFSRYTFDRTLERMSNITQDAMGNLPLSKASSTDFMLLFSPDNIQSEINNLKAEISIYKDSKNREDKQSAKKKQNKLDALKELKLDIIGYKSSIKNRSTSKQNQSDPEISEHAKLLHESYRKYIKTIANISGDHILDENVDNAFRGIKDFYELQDESINLASSVNYLTNPETFRELHSRAVEARKVAEQNRVDYLKEGLQEFIKRSEHNTLMNELFNIGVFFSPDEVDALIDHNKIPTKFYDVVNTGEIDSNSEKGKQVLEIVNKYKQATAPIEPEPSIVETKVVEPTPQNTKITIATSIDQLPKDLLVELVTEYKNQNNQRDITERENLDGVPTDRISRSIAFKNWIQGFPSAHKIIDNYNTKTGRIISPIIQEVKTEPKVTTEVKAIPEVVSDEELENFLNNGYVEVSRMKDIAQKIANNEKLSQGEELIYKSKFKTIDDLSEQFKPVVSDTQFIIPNENKLLLIHHGQDVNDAAEEVGGTQPTNLTSKGIDAANDTAKKAKKAGITKIISSPVERAMQTSEIISNVTKLSIEQDPDLSAWKIGNWDGVDREIFHKAEEWFLDHPNELVYPVNPEYKLDETFNQFKDRTIKAINNYSDAPEGTALITHSKNMKIWRAIENNGSWNEEAKKEFLDSSIDNAELEIKEPKEIIIESGVEGIETPGSTDTRSLEERFADIKNLESLEYLEGELLEDLYNPETRRALNLSGELINKLVEDKRKELARSINFADIKEGEVLVMRDRIRYGKNGLGIVMGKTDNNIKVAKLGEETGTIYAEPISNIEFKYNQGVVYIETKPTPTPEEAKIIQETVKNIFDTLGDPENIKAIEDSSDQPMRFDDLSPDDLDC